MAAEIYTHYNNFEKWLKNKITQWEQTVFSRKKKRVGQYCQPPSNKGQTCTFEH